jgi:hypothetical protein
LRSSLESIFSWTGRLTALDGIHLLNALKELIESSNAGSSNPISASASDALDALGKDKQIPLLACELKADR